ncbi:MAG: DUF2807 domain-containing protein [Pseudomonadota bacterium]
MIRTAAALFALTAAANAQESFDIDRIEIEDFIGTVLITIDGGGPATLTITQGDDVHEVEARASGGALKIDGDQNRRDWRRRGDFEEFLQEYPTLTIRAPEGVDLYLDDVVASLSAGDLGDFVVKSSELIGAVGDVETARVGLAGSGDFTIGDVEGDARVSVAGSGDIEIGAVGGEARLSIAGSGEIDAGDVGQGVDISISGSGSVHAESINGEADASISGSGDVEIEDGRASSLKVSIAGSGDFSFGGVAVDPKISVAGSGDVVLGGYEGSLRSSGNAKIRVKNKR